MKTLKSSLEPLESRITPGTVTVSFVNGVLSFAGSSTADGFSVSGDHGSGNITVEAYPGTQFTYGKGDITGTATSFELDKPVQAIKAKLGDGNDTVAFHGKINARLDLDLAGKSSGADNDAVMVGGWEWYGTKAVGGMKIKTGGGDDSVLIIGANIVGGTKVDLGSGLDSFVSLFSRFAGSLSIKASDGNGGSGLGADGVDIFGSRIVGGFAFTGGHEGADIRFGEGSKVGRDIKVSVRGAYAPVAAFGGENATSLTWDLWGDDHVGGNVRLLGANLVVSSSEGWGFSETGALPPSGYGYEGWGSLNIGGALIAKGLYYPETPGGPAMVGGSVAFNLWSGGSVTIAGSVVLSNAALQVSGSSESYFETAFTVGGSLIAKASPPVLSGWLGTEVIRIDLGTLGAADIAGSIKVSAAKTPGISPTGSLDIVLSGYPGSIAVGGNLGIRGSDQLAAIFVGMDGVVIGGKTTIRSSASTVAAVIENSRFAGAFGVLEGPSSQGTSLVVGGEESSSVVFGGAVSWIMGGGTNTASVAAGAGASVAFQDSWTVNGGGSGTITYAPSRITEAVPHDFVAITPIPIP